MEHKAKEKSLSLITTIAIFAITGCAILYLESVWYNYLFLLLVNLFLLCYTIYKTSLIRIALDYFISIGKRLFNWVTDDKDDYLQVFVRLASILITFAIIAIFLQMSFSLFDVERSGQFGDSFGSLNAIFSGLAFSGVIITILMQSAELRLQRDELQLQREEMRGSKEALKKQVDKMAKSSEITALVGLLEHYKVRGTKGAENIEFLEETLMYNLRIIKGSEIANNLYYKARMRLSKFMTVEVPKTQQTPLSTLCTLSCANLISILTDIHNKASFGVESK